MGWLFDYPVSGRQFAHIFRHPDAPLPSFLLTVDCPGLRRNGSSSQFIDPPQDFPKQVPGRGDFGQLERHVASPLRVSNGLQRISTTSFPTKFFFLKSSCARPRSANRYDPASNGLMAPDNA